MRSNFLNCHCEEDVSPTKQSSEVDSKFWRLLRHSLRSFLAMTIVISGKLFADTTSVAADSADKPFTPPDKGPLGIDISTGLMLYSLAILFAVLVVVIWRQNIIKRTAQ